MNRLLAVILVTGICLGLSTCGAENGAGEEPTGPSYTPVPDSDLYDQVTLVEGVTSVDISYDKSFTNGSSYSGTVGLGADVDGPAALARVYAILRQGRYQAAINVDAIQADQQITSRSFGLFSPVDIDLTKVFGPQPGDGSPPADTP